MMPDFAQPPDARLQFSNLDRWLAAALTASWLWLNLPTLVWFGQALLDLPRFNLLFLAAGALLLATQIWRAWPRFSLNFNPRPAPLLLLGCCALAEPGLRWWLDFEQLPAVLFLLGSYGLIGLVLPASVWRKGFPAAAAIALVLPFWVQFTTGLGFPARILTAEAVELILRHWHVAALSSEDIIVLDTGIAQVDLPCSGLKSLWVGTVLLLGLTWLERRQIGLRWLLVWLANLALLVAANVARVLTLVLLIYVLRQPVLAEMLHMPLGLVGFTTVSLLAWGLLRLVPKAASAATQPPSTQPQSGSSTRLNNRVWLAGLVLALLLLSVAPRPTATPPSLPLLAKLPWPAQIQTAPLPLTEPEQAFFVGHPGVVAQKQRFLFRRSDLVEDTAPQLSGSMILVASPTWQAHHSPELCYISSGFRVVQMRQQQLTSSVLGRWLTLQPNPQTTQTAAYWFQSPHRTTDSFLSRMWADLSRQEQSWTMISVLFDQPASPESPAVQAFLNQVQTTLNRAAS